MKEKHSKDTQKNQKHVKMQMNLHTRTRKKPIRKCREEEHLKKQKETIRNSPINTTLGNQPQKGEVPTAYQLQRYSHKRKLNV
jgi:hypothetical protein